MCPCTHQAPGLCYHPDKRDMDIMKDRKNSSGVWVSVIQGRAQRNGMVWPGEEKLRGIFQMYININKDGARLFPVVPSEDKKQWAWLDKTGIPILSIKRKLLHYQVAEHCNRLPRGCGISICGYSNHSWTQSWATCCRLTLLWAEALDKSPQVPCNFWNFVIWR